jgi:hypothetical protein
MERTSLNDFWLSLRTLAPGLALAASIAIAAVLIEPLATDTAAFIFDFPVAIPALVLALVAGMPSKNYCVWRLRSWACASPSQTLLRSASQRR